MVATKQLRKPSKLEDLLGGSMQSATLVPESKLFQYSAASVDSHIKAISLILSGKNFQYSKRPLGRYTHDATQYVEEIQVLDSPRFVKYEQRVETLKNYLATVKPLDYSTRDYTKIATAVSSMTSVFETYANASRDKRHARSEQKLAEKYMNIEMRPQTQEEKTYPAREAALRAKYASQKELFGTSIKSLNTQTQNYVNDPVIKSKRMMGVVTDVASALVGYDLEPAQREFLLNMAPPRALYTELPPIMVYAQPSRYSQISSSITTLLTSASAKFDAFIENSSSSDFGNSMKFLGKRLSTYANGATSGLPKAIRNYTSMLFAHRF